MGGNENKNLKTKSDPADEVPEKDKEPLNFPTEAEIMADPETKIETEPDPETKIETEPELKSEIKPEIKSETEELPKETILPKTERPQPPDMPLEEKKDLLSRAEIRTMAKDVSRLREAEAEKEKGRISNLKTEQNISKPTIDSQPAPVPEIKKELEGKLDGAGKLIPKPFKRPSTFQKIAIRVVAVLFLILTIAFFYWFLNIKLNQKSETKLLEQEITEPVATTTEPVATTTEPVATTTEPVATTTEPVATIKPETVRDIVTWGFYIPQTPRTIDTIIVHSAYNALGGDVHSVEKVIEEFRMYKVTSHYLIGNDGTIYQLAPDNAIAYHAGRGEMPDGSRKNIINNFSLGIEMIYSDTETPSEAQLEKLIDLISYLKKEYNIPIENILGHEDISLSGKDDPWNLEREEFINLLK